jgi:hypothetical protein
MWAQAFSTMVPDGFSKMAAFGEGAVLLDWPCRVVDGDGVLTTTTYSPPYNEYGEETLHPIGDYAAVKRVGKTGEDYEFIISIIKPSGGDVSVTDYTIATKTNHPLDPGAMVFDGATVSTYKMLGGTNFSAASYGDKICCVLFCYGEDEDELLILSTIIDSSGNMTQVVTNYNDISTMPFTTNTFTANVTSASSTGYYFCDTGGYGSIFEISPQAEAVCTTPITFPPGWLSFHSANNYVALLSDGLPPMPT